MGPGRWLVSMTLCPPLSGVQPAFSCQELLAADSSQLRPSLGLNGTVLPPSPDKAISSDSLILGNKVCPLSPGLEQLRRASLALPAPLAASLSLLFSDAPEFRPLLCLPASFLLNC